MARILLTCFFIITLSIPIALPSYMSICEINCDVSLVIDLDEEAEDVEIIKDSEFKIIPNFNTFFNYVYTTNQNKIIFISKEYNSVFQNLDSPPPDFNS